MTKTELKATLDKHAKWLRGADGGERANLSGANLSGANLSGANLSGANLSGANLSGAYLYGAYLSRAYLSRANLSGANLYGANLYGANLSGAYLSRANLSGANLYVANLSGANLSRANLSGANLYGANLPGANLSGANLYGANLPGAYLSGANLSGANLYGANLYGANLSGANLELDLLNKFLPICCPECGSFTAWKKVRGDYIVKLEVTETAMRSSAYGRKCRCSEARVLAIENVDGSAADVAEVYSQHDSDFVYRVGEIVRVDNFDTDRRNECAPGVHFFITRREAVYY